MATPLLTHHRLPGALGEILVDVRTGDRQGPRPAVLVHHGFKGFKDYGPFPPLAERLARAGFAAVTLSVSGSGVDAHGNFTQLDAFGHNTFSAELEDLGRVLGAMRSGALGIAPPTAIGVVGHSRGGGMAILLADRHPDITALVTWAAIATVDRWPAEEVARWRRDGRTTVLNSRTGQLLPLFTDVLEDVAANGTALDIGAAASRMAAPWLLVHGTADETVPVAEGRKLAELAGGRATALWLDGANHGFGVVHPFAGMTPHLSGLFDATVSHLSRHLP